MSKQGWCWFPWAERLHYFSPPEGGSGLQKSLCGLTESSSYLTLEENLANHDGGYCQRCSQSLFNQQNYHLGGTDPQEENVSMTDALPALSAYCIGCNCSDTDACLDDEGQPCSWLAVDRNKGVGVCSECADYQEQFQQQYGIGR